MDKQKAKGIAMVKYQNFSKLQKVRCASGGYVKLSYKDLCHKLGIIPDIHFAVVTMAGYIDFTCGKLNEIIYLANKAEEQGFLIGRGMKQTLTSEGRRA